MKTSVISEDFRERYLQAGHEGVFEGRAIVFDGSDDYHHRINDPALGIDENCILVIRGAGPLGWPGSAEVVNMQPPDALLKRGITSLPTLGDGRQSGTSDSPSILNASPESAAGGGLAWLRTGDIIRIDLEAGTLRRSGRRGRDRAPQGRAAAADPGEQHALGGAVPREDRPARRRHGARIRGQISRHVARRCRGTIIRELLMRTLAALLCALLLTTPALAQTDPNRLPPHLDPAPHRQRPRADPADGLEQLEQVRLQRQRGDRPPRRRRDGLLRHARRRLSLCRDRRLLARRRATPRAIITADRERFPSGMQGARRLRAFARASSSASIPTPAGRTCGGRPGSQGHEYQDALTYAAWGVDYLKYDWCATGTRNAEEAYALMADALRASGRDIVFSICEWGNNQPWLWAANIGNLWRTTGDIYDHWDGSTAGSTAS